MPANERVDGLNEMNKWLAAAHLANRSPINNLFFRFELIVL